MTSDSVSRLFDEVFGSETFNVSEHNRRCQPIDAARVSAVERAVTRSVIGKTCRSGSVHHLRTNHRRCPLNPRVRKNQVSVVTVRSTTVAPAVTIIYQSVSGTITTEIITNVASTTTAGTTVTATHELKRSASPKTKHKRGVSTASSLHFHFQVNQHLMVVQVMTPLPLLIH